MLRFFSRVWFSYILFLVFLGGILVIFIYIRSLSARVKIERIYNQLILLLVVLLITYFRVRHKGLSLFKVKPSSIRANEFEAVERLLCGNNYLLYLFVIFYLLVALYNVCFVIRIVKGPLTKFNYKVS